MAISDTDKLAIYNRALRYLGSRKLASLTENREPRRIMDDIWGLSNDGPEYCLTVGDWNFATRTVKAAYSPEIETSFGHRFAFIKPEDIVRLTALSWDPYFTESLTAHQYIDQTEYWLTDYQTLYVKYVSNDGDYGFDSSKWPEPFKLYLSSWMAYEGCERITNSTQKMRGLLMRMEDARGHAVSRDAMDEGVKFPPKGSWVKSRGGRGYRDANGYSVG